MSAINYVDRMQYTKHIDALQTEIARLKEKLETSLLHKSQSESDVFNTHHDYVDQKYFIDSQYIHNLKKQISILICQNDSLKIKNRELVEEIERLHGMIDN